MVNFMLTITAELENLTNLQPKGGPDDPNFSYFFKMKCGNCGEMTQKETCVMLSETVTSSNGRGTFHLVQKCKLCGREGTVLMIPGRGVPLIIQLAQRKQFVPMMLFDFRGFEPVDFFFGNGWEAESTSGMKFVDIDLSEGEFAEYDEEGKYPVLITNLQAKFVAGGK